jgi:hypothetical protein
LRRHLHRKLSEDSVKVFSGWFLNHKPIFPYAVLIVRYAKRIQHDQDFIKICDTRNFLERPSKKIPTTLGDIKKPILEPTDTSPQILNAELATLRR